jgi:hypothetical protein
LIITQGEAGSYKVEAEKVRWQRFQLALGFAGDVIVRKFRTDGLPEVVQISLLAGEEKTMFVTLILKKNGDAIFLPVYEITRSGLREDNASFEVRFALDRLIRFCFVAMAMKNAGILFTDKQDAFVPTEKEDKLGRKFRDELDRIRPDYEKRWLEATPNLKSIWSAVFLEDGRKFIVVTVRIENSFGATNQFAVAKYPLEEFRQPHESRAIKKNAKNAAEKILIYLKSGKR